MWVVVVGLAVFFALDLSISAYGNWRSNPVLTTVWTTGHPIEKIPFPSITICAQGSVNEIIGIYIPHTKACWRLHNYASMCGRCLSSRVHSTHMFKEWKGHFLQTQQSLNNLKDIWRRRTWKLKNWDQKTCVERVFSSSGRHILEPKAPQMNWYPTT